MATGTSYVIKEWYVSETANSHGHFIRIKGRAPGLISWILALIGIDDTVTFEVDNKNLIYSAGSWAGMVRKSIPLSMISSVYYGYAKPWQTALVIAVLGSLITAGIGALVFVPIALIYYVLNKTLTLGVGEVGGILSAINIKRSVIEGKKLDESDAETAYHLIQRLIDHANRKSH